MIYKGVGGSLELLDDRLIIRRTMLLGTFLHGLKGDKTIPYSAITAVQYKRPFGINGYIQFTLGGGNESRKGIIDATHDENTLFFSHGANFDEARKFVEDRIGVRAQVAPVAQAAGSAADDLLKLASLRDKGILSNEEFEEQKAKVLGKTYSPTAPRTASPVAVDGANAIVAETEQQPSAEKLRMLAAMDRAIQAAASTRPAAPSFGKRSGR
jgi:hypothetical protein